MTQFKLSKAYPSLVRLAEYRLPVKKALAIYKITKKAEEHFRFAAQEERKYIEEFDGKINTDGTISFDSPEQYGKFSEKLADLNDLQIEWTDEPVVLTEADLGEQQISPSDIFNLEEFVSFD